MRQSNWCQPLEAEDGARRDASFGVQDFRDRCIRCAGLVEMGVVVIARYAPGKVTSEARIKTGTHRRGQSVRRS